MRLSELSTDAAASVLVSIIPYIEKIMRDPVVTEKIIVLPKERDNSTLGLFYLGLDKATEVIPWLLKDHKDDLFQVIAILNGMTAEAVAKQNVMITMAQIKEIFEDKDLVDFFKSSALMDLTT